MKNFGRRVKRLPDDSLIFNADFEQCLINSLDLVSEEEMEEYLKKLSGEFNCVDLSIDYIKFFGKETFKTFKRVSSQEELENTTPNDNIMLTNAGYYHVVNCKNLIIDSWNEIYKIQSLYVENDILSFSDIHSKLIIVGGNIRTSGNILTNDLDVKGFIKTGEGIRTQRHLKNK